MKVIFCLTLLIGTCLIGRAQNKDSENVPLEFFYGTWTDSTKSGTTLTNEGNLLPYPRKEMRGADDVDCSFTYKIFLEVRPIVIEVTREQCVDISGSKVEIPGSKVVRAQIKIANDRQIYLTPLDHDGKPKEGLLLTKQ